MVQALTPYWDRMVQQANRILSREIEELSQAPEGSWLALERESDLSILERMKDGGMTARLWALDVVTRHNIASVFHPG